MKRREFLKTSLTTALLATLGRYDIAGAATDTGAQAFTEPLFIPPLLTAPPGDPSPLTLNVGRGTRSFLAGTSTKTLGYNGSFLGPTIRVKNGDQFRIRVQNLLDETTTLHWHGLHVPAAWDGGPRQVIAPGGAWNPDFRIKQQAATLWYHPHAMGITGEQVYRGLAGLFIIDDAISVNLPIPQDYGIDDLPLIIQDRRFATDGSFLYVRSMHDVMHGVLGNVLLVNGSSHPFVDVPQGIVRLRVLNGSNSSIYRVRLPEEVPFYVIASDGGFLTRPVEVNHVILSAGERAELLLDLADHKAGDTRHLIVDQFNGMSFEALEIRITDRQGPVRAVPRFLREQPPLDASTADRVRHFAMQTMTGGMGMGMMGGQRLSINGRKMDLNRIDVKIPLNSTEIWEITNTSSSMMQLPHSMHLHDVQFNILNRNGERPSAVEAGRKDTVLLWPGDRVRIIARFENYTGIYMYHCHLLEHEDDGMMGQFEVIDTANPAG